MCPCHTCGDQDEVPGSWLQFDLDLAVHGHLSGEPVNGRYLYVFFSLGLSLFSLSSVTVSLSLLHCLSNELMHFKEIINKIDISN